MNGHPNGIQWDRPPLGTALILYREHTHMNIRIRVHIVKKTQNPAQRKKGRRLLRRAAAWGLVLTMAWAGVACGGATLPPAAEVVLAAMLEAAPGHPAGWAYARTADPSGVDYLPGSGAPSGEGASGDISQDRAQSGAQSGESDSGQRVFYLTGTLFAALYGSTGRGWLGADSTNRTDTADGGTASPAPTQANQAEGAAEAVPTLIQDGAVFLSTVMHPFELGVFRCADLDGALSVAALCQTRLDTLRTTWQNSAYAVCVERAVVTVEGCYVLFIVADDPEPLLEAARRAIR